MKDKQGNTYAKLSEMKDGAIVYLDARFTCHSAGQVTVYMDGDHAYFICDEGRHYLSGQADDGINCIGVYLTKPDWMK